MRTLLSFSAMLFAYGAWPVWAQASEGEDAPPVSPTLSCTHGTEDRTSCEQVIVTRRRVEPISEVPASLTLSLGDELREWGYQDVQSLSLGVPNLHYSTNVGASDNIVVRGLGTTGAGPQFESGVGQLFNGMVLERSRFGRMPWFDMRSVEFFRGPQGAIGKNHSLGAIAAYPNVPATEFEAFAFASYGEAQHGGPSVDVEGAVSGPISNRLSARLSSSLRKGGGWYENAIRDTSGSGHGYAGGDINAPDREDYAGRMMLTADFHPTQIDLLYQHMDMLHLGKPRELVSCSADPDELIAFAFGKFTSPVHPERHDCTADLINRSNVGNGGDETDGRVPPVNTDFGYDEPWDAEADIFTLRVTRDTDRHVIELLYGAAQYDMRDVVDADLDPDTLKRDGLWKVANQRKRNVLPAGFPPYLPQPNGDYVIRDINYLENNEKYQQQSVELRIATQPGRPLEYAAGIHWLEYDVEYRQDHAFTNWFGHRRVFADIEDESLGAFAEITVRPWLGVAVNAGVRYIVEEKSADTSRRFYTFSNQRVVRHQYEPHIPYPTIAMQRAEFPVVDMPCLSASRGPFRWCSDVLGDRRDEALTYNANVRWWLDEGSTMLFASAATGYKAGGFNIVTPASQLELSKHGATDEYGRLSIESDESAFLFDPEDSLGLEIGGTHSLSETIDARWAIFDTRVANMQVSSAPPGSITHSTFNAASARSRGLELSLRHRGDRTKWGMELAGTLAKYRSFPEAACYAPWDREHPQLKASGSQSNGPSGNCVPNGNDGGNDGGTALIQDLSGRRLARAPKWSAVVDAEVVLAQTARVRYALLGKVVGSSGYHINTELSPLPAAYQDGYAKADLGLKASPPEGGWTALLLIRNLTDERTYSLVNANEVYAYYVGEGSAFGFGDPGRVVSIKLHYRL